MNLRLTWLHNGLCGSSICCVVVVLLARCFRLGVVDVEVNR